MLFFCRKTNETLSTSHKHTNSLIHETSPYLLQHAHNPVDWYAWSTETLEKAEKENKLLLISIGYAACHWCHVMEHECFEDEDVAKVMNRHFVNIKIDREERPDIDHIYMDALQMMTGSGGWPLNVVALPDGRPFWGATFVKKEQWIKVLGQLSQLYAQEKSRVLEYADQLTQGLRSINLIPPPEKDEPVSLKELSTSVKKWSQYFDTFLGGYRRAPKFMMPVNLDFLLHYANLTGDTEVEDYVHTTLKRMAYGGVYDHVGGGFSRYAVDVKWHVPHFEKMLYDNAQLISLYAKAYAATGYPLYRKVVEESISFVCRELRSPEGGFYSSLDADSLDKKGVLREGAFYVWKEEELRELLKGDFTLFADYYNINDYGLWEEDLYVLIRDSSREEMAKKHGLATENFEQRIHACKEILFKRRESRSRPRLDDKILTSWNALMVKALIEASRYLKNETYLKMALMTIEFLEGAVVRKDGSLFHNHKEGNSTIAGFLEDYALLIDAYIHVYEVTFEERWIIRALELTDHCLDHFLKPTGDLFFFTSDQEAVTVRRSVETADNVIPASNSVMAMNLFRLSCLYPDRNYGHTANRMLRTMRESILENPNSHAHWMHMPLFDAYPFREVVITGESAHDFGRSLRHHYFPNTLFAGAIQEGSLSLLKGRIQKDKTLIYICEAGACNLPVSSPEEALEQLRSGS